jgi:hypothetical protein
MTVHTHSPPPTRFDHPEVPHAHSSFELEFYMMLAMLKGTWDHEVIQILNDIKDKQEPEKAVDALLGFALIGDPGDLWETIDHFRICYETVRPHG